MLYPSFKQQLVTILKAVYNHLNHLSGGTLDILKRAIQRLNEENAFEIAAGMAYYALFSLFPLLLVLIGFGSFFLESTRAQRRVLGWIGEYLPASQEVIAQNIAQILELRGSISIIGLVGLLWAATAFFNALAYHINCAWEVGQMRGFLERRLIALGMVGGLAMLLLLSVLLSAAFDLMSRFQRQLPLDPALYGLSLEGFLAWFIPVFFRTLIFVGLYRWVPNTKVRWLEAFWGALVASLGWEITTFGFTWYLGSGLAQYEVVYGSVGTIIVLMLWIYLGSLITLFGAHLSAAVAWRHRR